MANSTQKRDLAVLERAALAPISRAYRDAFAESQLTRRPVSFRVDADPSGAVTITPVPAAGLPPTVVDASTELAAALSAARQRGQALAATILTGRDMLSADKLAARLGVSRMTVNTKRQKGQLLGLDGAKRGFRFPLWQLDQTGRPWPELPALHEQLGSPWAVYRFLEQPQNELRGLTGRQALDRGMVAAVLSAAESVGRGDFR